jgi:4-amino-4-deoxy-L-arabinose transferase-like glycosyltransferase
MGGFAFIGKAGLHYDASYELASVYACCTPAFRPVIFGWHVPVMILPYLGAFKTWLYYPLLQWFDVTPFLLRLPVLLAGAASVWLFFRVLDRTIGRWGAIAGALLLATDGIFVIATTYDFGPLALLHCFLLAGVMLLLDFERRPSNRKLALAFFLFGLALWHKALFVWMLNGLTAGALVAFPRRVLALVTPRRLAVAAVALCAGALPLIWYNIVRPGATLHTNEVMSGAAPMSQKLLMVSKTMSGNAIFGWLTEESQPANTVAVTAFPERLAVKISRMAGGNIRHDGLFYAFVAALCLVTWIWFSKLRSAAIFVVVYLAVAWAQMAALPNTGATLHHVLLLWPFPHFLIAIALTRLSWAFGPRRVWIVPAVLVASNLLVLNQYYADLATRGTSAIWTDAIYPLLNRLDSLHTRRIIVTDWGYSTTLCLLSDGTLPLYDISYTLLNPSEKEAAWIRSLIDDPRNLFVQHAAGSEQFPAAVQRFPSLAAQENRAREVLAVIADRNGRPRFEIVRYFEVISR